MNKIIKVIALSALAVGLGACSSLKKHSTGKEAGVYEAGASSRGVGAGDRFSENGGDAMSAPHNQTYHFAFDDSSIRKSDLPSIESQAKYLQSHRDSHIRLEGNTDARGSREYNIALGERRAKAVREYMEMTGVNRDQTKVVSYGQEKPVATGHDEEAYQQNRRVELKYKSE